MHDTPAFPFSPKNSGMSLRDYFAARAMIQLMDSFDNAPAAEMRAQITKAGATGAYALVALRAYEMADAMLAFRSR